MTTRSLYLFGCAAPPVLHIGSAVAAAQAEGWEVCLGLTPTAHSWLGDRVAELEELTGHPVRNRWRRPGESGAPWPPADVIAVAPATLNSISALALGLTPSYVVGVAAEAIGAGVPVVVMPCVKTTLAAHPAMDRSVETLRTAGVRVLYGEGGFVPNSPGQGRPEEYPWWLVLDAADQALGRGRPAKP
jgi:hypothetical protein